MYCCELSGGAGGDAEHEDGSRREYRKKKRRGGRGEEIERDSLVGRQPQASSMPRAGQE